MVTTWPKNFSGLGTAAEGLAKAITLGSGGSLNVKVYAAGELVPPFESFDAVSQGTADLYHGAEDFKGLKMRMPGLGGEVLRRVGATAVSLPGGEIFPALQAGTIDATEWVGPWNDLAFGFYKVAKYYYWPGFHEPGTTLSSGVNKAIWDSLDAGQQSLITSCMAAANDFTLAEFNAKNSDALDTLVNKHNVEVRRTPNELLNALGDASGKVAAEVATSDPLTQRVYDSFIAFRRKAITYAKKSDQAFWQARSLPFKFD